MILVCPVISHDHVIKGLGDIMVSCHSAKFCAHNHGGSGDMFLVAEKGDSRCPYVNLPSWLESTWHMVLITPILVTHA